LLEIEVQKMTSDLKIKERIKNIPITMGDILEKIYHTCRKRSNIDKLNVNHDRKLVFIHIPKTAGTSIKAIVLPQQRATKHCIPEKLVSSKVWNNYTTFCVVRNPFDHFISSYFYHTSKDYKGGLFRKNKNIHNLSLDEYFEQVYSSISIL
jgi:hypothetical protein